jgi:hypothetical protein
VNRSFAGFSAFDTQRLYAVELAGAMRLGACRHIVMCHPGYPDPETAALDPVDARRGQELAALLEETDLSRMLWRISRPADGPPVDWATAYPDG